MPRRAGPGDPLLAGLTDEQREAVTSDAAPLLVLAGAGSGKTRVLTRRIAWQAAAEAIDPRRTLAVTFTRKAASELRRRLRDLGIHEQVTAGTFHALALAQLRRRWLDQGRRPPTLLDRKTRLLARLLPRGAGDLVGLVAREIEWAQARGLTPEGYEEVARAERRAVPLPVADLARAFVSYREAKRKKGVVDFDDLLALCADDVERDSELAAAVQWQFRHIFVDEFQDLTPSQFRLLQAWLGGRPDLFAVGDDEQAIYGFGGGDATYLLGFRTHFGAEATVLRLTANFRSTPQILAVANAISAPAPGDERRLRPTAADGPKPILTAYESDDDEAAAIADRIGELQREGVRGPDIAVLARTNAQCASLEAALSAAGIPARVRGGSRLLDRVEVERTFAALAGDAPFLARLALAAADAPRPHSDSEAVLSLLVELGEEYAARDAAATADGFREFVAAEVRDDDPTPATHAVEILTFHRAKGLEWPAVFVTGLEDGFVPIAHATSAATRDEERRLLHVALTRAGRRLFLSWARARSFGGRQVKREPSPFLAGVAHHLPTEVSEARGATTEAGLQALREASARLRESDPSQALTDALRAWREARARAAGVPEAAILDDVSLRAISAARPVDEEHLGEVSGLGAVRLARYGPEIIEVVAGYAP